MQLRALRKRRGLSLRQLQELSGVTYSTISGMERGERAVGAESAEHLANGLQLALGERDQFLFAAAATRRKDRLVGYARSLEPELLNFLPKALADHGVSLPGIERSRLASNTEGLGERPRLLADLRAAFDRALEAVAGRQDGDFLVVEGGGKKHLCTLLLVPAA